MAKVDTKAPKVIAHNDLEVIRFLIDLSNLLKPERGRIDNTDRQFFEAMVLAYKKLGTINSQACDDFIREYLDKPTLSRRSFRNYRTVLYEKGWLKKVERQYEILDDALRLHNKIIPTKGAFTFQIILERINDELVRGDSDS